MAHARQLDQFGLDLLEAALDALFDLGALLQGLEAGVLALLELGVGFAFVGSQYHLEVGDEEFYLDLLFYHTKLHCYVVVELKLESFKPEFAGKMNFYLSAVDAMLKTDSDNPSIGLLLCKTKNNVKVEFALKDINKPIGVAGDLTKSLESLPKKLQSSLPTIEDIEAELLSDKKQGIKKKRPSASKAKKTR